MAWAQVGGPSYTQLTDATNPAAQSYARLALARNGIHVPPGADAAAMWRQYSQSRALQRNQAQFQSQNEAPDYGVSPQDIPPSQPDQGMQFDPSTLALGQHLPGGGVRQQFLQVNGLVGQANNMDWRNRIAAMASQLHDNPQFQVLQGGPAEAAMNRLIHVNQATSAAQAMARNLAHGRPSRRIPQGIMRPKAY